MEVKIVTCTLKSEYFLSKLNAFVHVSLVDVRIECELGIKVGPGGVLMVKIFRFHWTQARN